MPSSPIQLFLLGAKTYMQNRSTSRNSRHDRSESIIERPLRKRLLLVVKSLIPDICPDLFILRNILCCNNVKTLLLIIADIFKGQMACSCIPDGYRIYFTVKLQSATYFAAANDTNTFISLEMP